MSEGVGAAATQWAAVTFSPVQVIAPGTSSCRRCVCVNCGYVYGDYDDLLIDKPWFLCGKCGRWGHESCGNVAHHGLKCHIIVNHRSLWLTILNRFCGKG